MTFYANRTRFSAIVTLRIDVPADDAKPGLKIGTDGAFEEHVTKAVGYYDFLVDAGKELHLINNVSATFVSVRTSP